METHRAIAQELEDQIGLIELGEAEGDADVVAEAEEACANSRNRRARRNWKPC